MDRQPDEAALQHVAAQLLVAAQRKPQDVAEPMKALAAELQLASVSGSVNAP